ncbi:MAG: hypothetical protein JW776_08995 [Candidatus Lokiarchaeota archaeon]|nr:hypothetical protein [Candidatus Lokiarchaeota archaeon]
MSDKNIILEPKKFEGRFYKALRQIWNTMKFEWQRKWSSLLAMIGTAILIFVLNLVIEVLQLNRGGELAATASEYAQSYMGFISLFIYIIGCTFVGSIIVEDFEKSTGNLLFPKITKERLLIGRFTARYIYGFLALLTYYTGVTIITFIRFSVIPVNLYASFLWAAYYLLAVYAFVALFSSFFKRTAGSVIVSLLSLLIVFTMVQSILQFTGITIEPLLFLTYYSNIITYTFNMPEERFQELPFGPPSNPDAQTFYRWITPNELGAGIGLMVYTVVLLIAAYIIYEFRQSKGNM